MESKDLPKMVTKKEFTNQVEALLVKTKNADVISCILKVCEDNKVDPESAKRLLSQPLKEKLEAEATQLNLINRNSRSQGSIEAFYSKSK